MGQGLLKHLRSCIKKPTVTTGLEGRVQKKPKKRVRFNLGGYPNLQKERGFKGFTLEDNIKLAKTREKLEKVLEVLREEQKIAVEKAVGQLKGRVRIGEGAWLLWCRIAKEKAMEETEVEEVSIENPGPSGAVQKPKFGRMITLVTKEGAFEVYLGSSGSKTETEVIKHVIQVSSETGLGTEEDPTALEENEQQLS